MKLYPQQLNVTLNKSLLPIYLISGDETLLVEESRDALTQAAKKQGFNEKNTYGGTSQFNWQTLQQSLACGSLFSDKEIIDLRLTSIKQFQEGKEILGQYLEDINTDKLLIITLPKMEAQQKKAKWFTALEAKSGFIECWPVDKDRFPAWLKERFAQAKFTIDNKALAVLITHLEGNLLASKQFIEKCRLFYKPGPLHEADLMEIITKHSQYELFALSDDILQTDLNRILQTLHYLKENGTEPILVLWLLTKELRCYLQLLQTPESAHASLFPSLQIWPKRQSLYQQLGQKHTPEAITALLISAQQIDAMLKGQALGDAWDALTHLALAMANRRVFE
jgi:DNA polymerase-3 subunit delta